MEYCEEKLRCRRVLLMEHFGEAFDPGRCAKTCDICSRTDRQYEGKEGVDARSYQIDADHGKM